jgi:hypothetical protein
VIGTGKLPVEWAERIYNELERLSWGATEACAIQKSLDMNDETCKILEATPFNNYIKTAAKRACIYVPMYSNIVGLTAVTRIRGNK